MGQKGILQCSFAPNRFKISQEITELWLLLPGMLSDSIEKRNGQRIIICCSFVLKWSKNGQKVAELWPYSPWEVGWFLWGPYGSKGDPYVFICNEKIQYYLREVGWFQWDPPWTKVGPWVLICTKMIQNQSRNGWVTAILPPRGWAIPLRTTWDKRWILGCSFVPKISKISQEISEIWY